MKRFIKGLFAVGLTVCLSVIGFAACNEEPQNSGALGDDIVRSLSIDRDDISLDRYESTKLTVTMNNIDGEISWNSSDTGVVTVSADGTLQAQGDGAATITATMGEYSDTCSVIVENSGALPMLALTTRSLEIEKGSTFAIGASVSYKSLLCEGAEIFYSVTDGSDFIEVSSDGTVTANAVGEAKIFVTASWRGADANSLLSMKEEVVVKVKSIVETELSAYEYAIYTVDELNGNTYGKTATIGLKVTDDGADVAMEAIDWFVLSGAECVSLNGNTVTGVKEGMATVGYEYTAKDGSVLSGEVIVKVNMPTVALDKTVYFEKYSGVKADSAATAGYSWVQNTAYAIDGSSVIDGFTVTRVVDAATDTTIAAENSLDITALDTTDGESVRWILYGAEYGVEVNVVIADYVLSSEAEFVGYWPILKSGYVVLDRNLDFSAWYQEYDEYHENTSYNSFNYYANNGNVTPNRAYYVYPLGKSTNANVAALTSKDPFTGHFDGQGHAIKGLRLANSAFVYRLSGATMENLALEVVNFTGSHGLLASHTADNTGIVIKNVYVSFDLKNKTEGGQVGLIHTIQSGVTLENCIVDIKDSGATETSRKNFGLLAYQINPTQRFTLKNSYFLYNGEEGKTAVIANIPLATVKAASVTETKATEAEVTAKISELRAFFETFESLLSEAKRFYGYPEKEAYISEIQALADAEAGVTVAQLQAAIDNIKKKNTAITNMKGLTYHMTTFQTKAELVAYFANTVGAKEAFDNGCWNVSGEAPVFKNF